jgi:hypothetical protein
MLLPNVNLELEDELEKEREEKKRGGDGEGEGVGERESERETIDVGGEREIIEKEEKIVPDGKTKEGHFSFSFSF